MHATGTSKTELGGMPLENERNVAIVMSQSARLIEFRGMPRLETVLEVEMNKNPGSLVTIREGELATKKSDIAADILGRYMC